MLRDVCKSVPYEIRHVQVEQPVQLNYPFQVLTPRALDYHGLTPGFLPLGAAQRESLPLEVVLDARKVRRAVEHPDVPRGPGGDKLVETSSDLRIALLQDDALAEQRVEREHVDLLREPAGQHAVHLLLEGADEFLVQRA